MDSNGQTPDPRRQDKRKRYKLPKWKGSGRPLAPEPKNVTVPGRETRPVKREKR